MYPKFLKIHILVFLIIFSGSSLSIPYQSLPPEDINNPFISLSMARKKGVLICGKTTAKYAGCYTSLRPMKYGNVRTFDVTRYDIEVSIDSSNIGTISVNSLGINETVFDRVSTPLPHCPPTSSIFNGAGVDYLHMNAGKPPPHTMSINFIVENSVGYENTTSSYYYGISYIYPNISNLQVPVTYLSNEQYGLNMIGHHTGVAVVTIDNILAQHNCPNAHYYEGDSNTIF